LFFEKFSFGAKNTTNMLQLLLRTLIHLFVPHDFIILPLKVRDTQRDKYARGIHSELRFPFKASIFRLYETDLPLVTVKLFEKT